MNRPYSSKIGKKPSLPLGPSMGSSRREGMKEEKNLSPRSPLQDVNGISSSNSSSQSSSISIEAPRGCLRFFLSNSSASNSKKQVHKPKNRFRSPKSAPTAVPSKSSKSNLLKENLPKCTVCKPSKSLISGKVYKCKKNPTYMSGKKSSSTAGKMSKNCCVQNVNGNLIPHVSSGSEELKKNGERLEKEVDGACEPTKQKLFSDELTPVSKITRAPQVERTVSVNLGEESNKSISKTPPIKASVSPEIQSHSMATTPACYGAGYVVSGVADKRKCRPRGILIIEENESELDKKTSFDDNDDKKARGCDINLDASLVPLPNEASMCWLLSPGKKGNEYSSEKSEIGSDQLQGSVESTVLLSISPPFEDSDLTIGTKSISRRAIDPLASIGRPEFQRFLEPISSSQMPVILSPYSTPHCQVVSLKEGRNNADQNSPFSIDSLGSGNIMQTPQSESSSDLNVDLSWVHTTDPEEHNVNSELNLIDEVPRFFHGSHEHVKDSFESSFSFVHSALALGSFDQRPLPKILDDQDAQISGSFVESVSPSQLCISWREGLLSRIFDMDEFDCCRCLSDEEEEDKIYSNGNLFPNHGSLTNVDKDGHRKSSDNLETTDGGDTKKVREICTPLVSFSCAESISTDGGSLIASRDDSDWNLCYKNELFQV